MSRVKRLEKIQKQKKDNFIFKVYELLEDGRYKKWDNGEILETVPENNSIVVSWGI